MKKFSHPLSMRLIMLPLLAVAFLFQACEEPLAMRVEAVAAPYDCVRTCTETDLTQQLPTTTFSDSSVIFVRKPKEWEDGYIQLLDREFFLTEDNNFTYSASNYFVSGEFDGEGGLRISEDIVDTDLQVRTQCTYVCTRQ